MSLHLMFQNTQRLFPYSATAHPAMDHAASVHRSKSSELCVGPCISKSHGFEFDVRCDGRAVWGGPSQEAKRGTLRIAARSIWHGSPYLGDFLGLGFAYVIKLEPSAEAFTLWTRRTDGRREFLSQQF